MPRDLTPEDIARLPRRFRLEFARRAMLAEQRERERTAPEFQRALAKMLANLHDAQKRFVADRAKRRAALCSRRAGKSRVFGAWLLEGAAEAPGEMSLYVAWTKSNARGTLWTQGLEPANREFGLGLVLKEVDNQLMVCCPNGHQIWLAGCKNQGEVGKFRGFKYKRAVVDEAQLYGSFMSELIEESIDPALADLDGDLGIGGTPGPIPAGYFYEATTGDGEIEKWSTHQWTIHDNPYFRGGRSVEYIEEKKRRLKWDDKHPTLLREWGGLWVLDVGALVYPFSATRNAYRDDAVPPGPRTYMMGVDLGFEDSAAFVVGFTVTGHPEVYVCHAEKHSGLIPSAVAAHVERLWRQWDLTRVVVDEGGFGKGYAEEMRQSYAIPVEPAEKARKRAFQELVGGDLKSGAIRIHPYAARCLIDELQVLQWNEDKSAEDESFANHAADGFLYLCRALKPWYKPEQDDDKRQSEELKQKLREMKRRAQKQWWKR